MVQVNQVHFTRKTVVSTHKAPTMRAVVLTLFLLALLLEPSHQLQLARHAPRSCPSCVQHARDVYTMPRAHVRPLRMQTHMSVAIDDKVSGQMVNVRSHSWRTIPDMWPTLSSLCPNNQALVDEVHEGQSSFTYSQLDEAITNAAAGLQALGVSRGDCISMFSENSARWFLIDQAIMKAGASNAVRGGSAPVNELHYIYGNSLSSACVVESEALLSKLLTTGQGLGGSSNQPRFILVLFPRGRTGAEISQNLGLGEAGPKIVTFEELTSAKHTFQPVHIDSQSTATIVYTSGTTSKPKGVVLKHSNLMSQVIENSFNRAKGQKLDPWIGDVFVSILPCWHIFERTAEYWTLARGVTMVYSSLKSFKNDLKRWKPQFIIAVPRLFESIYTGAQQSFAAQTSTKRKLIAAFKALSMLHMKAKRVLTNMVIRPQPPPLMEKILSALLFVLTWPLVRIADKLAWRKVREGLGGKVKVLVSGGSSMPAHIEDFFEMIGEKLIVGYGLTETSPVISNRVAEHNLPGSCGSPPPGTLVKLVDPVTKQEVKKGEPGVIMVKSEGVMTGYMQDEEATRQVINSEGWFDTGDLGRLNPVTGDLIITGRAKDTIVLSNGENVEPQPIEDEILSKSPLIDQVMLVGQDQKFLSALVVVSPSNLQARGLISKEKALHLMSIIGSTPTSTGPVGDVEVLRTEADLLHANPTAYNAVMEDIQKICAKFQRWEQVRSVRLLLEPFSVANGLLTQTLKVKRNVVAERYHAEIDKFYGKRGQMLSES